MNKILIVEDEVMLQIVIAKMVQKAGYDPVERVKSAKAAIEAVRKHQPDLILMDVKIIGETDGIGAARLIRDFSNVPVIFLTGFSDAFKESDLDGLHPFSLLSKPFDYQELASSIESAFEKASKSEQP